MVLHQFHPKGESHLLITTRPYHISLVFRQKRNTDLAFGYETRRYGYHQLTIINNTDRQFRLRIA